MTLTKRQILSFSCYSRKKLNINTEAKTKVVNNKLKQFNQPLVILPEQLEWFYNEWLNNQWKRMKRERFLKAQSGELDIAHTPLHLSKTKFDEVLIPEIGNWYHLTWAFKGAKFQLKSIEKDKGVVWTGKTKNKLMQINLKDLRHLK